MRGHASLAEANARVGAASVRREYPAPVEVVPGVVLEPLERVGYASTILGRPCWIAHDFRNVTPKRREDCTPFSYTLADGGDAVAQERFVKGLAKLERATARAAKARAPKVAPAKAAKVATVRMRAGVVLEVLGLPRGYSFQVEEVV